MILIIFVSALHAHARREKSILRDQRHKHTYDMGEKSRQIKIPRQKKKK